MFDYKLIEALAMVAREGGFDRAARVLHITQSAVSQRVKLLEEITGQVLITRTTPPQATTAGQKLLKHYLQVKRLEDDLMGEIDGPAPKRDFTSIAAGINADSLALWLLEAIHPFLIEERVLLDIRVHDQEQTHRLLKDGEVMGCISTQEQPIQGCRMEYMGRMNYRMMAAPQFASQWFPNGLTMEDVQLAPAIIFDRQDELHGKLLQQTLEEVPHNIPTHYVPSVQRFADFITLGLAYGMLPDQQSSPLLHTGKVIDLSPTYHVPVKLYWHCWNLKSDLLEKLTRRLVRNARTLLEE